MKYKIESKLGIFLLRIIKILNLESEILSLF